MPPHVKRLPCKQRLGLDAFLQGRVRRQDDASTSPRSSSRSRNARSASLNGSTMESAVALFNKTAPYCANASCSGGWHCEPSWFGAGSPHRRPRRSANPCGSCLRRQRRRSEPFALELGIENAIAIEQVSRLPAREQRRELPGHEFVQVENRNTPGLELPERVRIVLANLPSGCLYMKLKSTPRFAGCPVKLRVAQPGLSAGIRSAPPNGEPFTGKHRPGRRCPRAPARHGATPRMAEDAGSRRCRPSSPGWEFRTFRRCTRWRTFSTVPWSNPLGLAMGRFPPLTAPPPRTDSGRDHDALDPLAASAPVRVR